MLCRYGYASNPPGGGTVMGAAGLALFGLVALFFGGCIGWWARRAAGSHGDMKVNKARVPTFRRARNRAGLRVALLVVIALLAIKVVLTLH
jgi:uncharacterized iron-regulated membrane protein